MCKMSNRKLNKQHYWRCQENGSHRLFAQAWTLRRNRLNMKKQRKSSADTRSVPDAGNMKWEKTQFRSSAGPRRSQPTQGPAGSGAPALRTQVLDNQPRCWQPFVPARPAGGVAAGRGDSWSFRGAMKAWRDEEELEAGTAAVGRLGLQGALFLQAAGSSRSQKLGGSFCQLIEFKDYSSCKGLDEIWNQRFIKAKKITNGALNLWLFVFYFIFFYTHAAPVLSKKNLHIIYN